MSFLSLTHHPNGVAVGPGDHVVYDLDAGAAVFGEGSTSAPSLLFSLGDEPMDPLMSKPVDLDAAAPMVLRCDRIDFPPGGIAYLHTHPGPGIRCQLFGELTVTTEGRSSTYGRLEPWFESGPDPVYAEASPDGPAAFVRAMLLPLEWKGRRTIRYQDPADADKPKLQTATVYGEIEITVG